jgi:hypothetical protein
LNQKNKAFAILIRYYKNFWHFQHNEKNHFSHS